MANVNNNNAFSVRKAAAQPTGWAAVAAFAAGEALTKVTKAISGNGYKTMACARYLDKRATGSVFGGFDLNAAFAVAKAEQEEAAAPQPAPAQAKGVSISPMVTWDQWHWVPSKLAEEEARKQGYEKALLLYLYKASNALICLAKYGKGDLAKVYKGRSYAEWICMALTGHAEWLRTEKGVADAHSRLGQYYAQAAKRAFVACPNWEEVKAVAIPAKQAKPEPVPQPAPVPEPPVEEVPEVREGRAPAFDDLDAEAEVSDADPEPEVVVRKYDELRKVVGVTAVRANNAKAAALKAAAAFEAGKINASEMRLFLEKAASKLPEGSDEAAAILAIA